MDGVVAYLKRLTLERLCIFKCTKEIKCSKLLHLLGTHACRIHENITCERLKQQLKVVNFI